MYNIDNFSVIMHPSHSSNNRRPHYGLALYSKLQTLQSCQPVSLATSYGTVECALLQVAVEPSILLTVVCVYRCPSSDFRIDNSFRNSLNFMMVISLYVCCINKCTDIHLVSVIVRFSRLRNDLYCVEWDVKL